MNPEILAAGEVIRLHDTLRAGLFTGFLSCGSLAVASMAFLSTRLHDYYSKESYISHMAMVEREAGVDLDHYAPALVQMVEVTRWAARICFAVAILQITIGILNVAPLRAFCLLSAILGAIVMAAVVEKTLSLYSEVVLLSRQDWRKATLKLLGKRVG